MGLLGIGYLVYSPDAPPAGAFLVDAQAHTYLEAEPDVQGFWDPDTTWSLVVYYTQVGGWFSPTKRIRWAAIPTAVSAKALRQKVPHILFMRLPARPDSVLRISLSCAGCPAPYGLGSLAVFEKPRVFPATGYRP
jgi:hypothetical protein